MTPPSSRGIRHGVRQLIMVVTALSGLAGVGPAYGEGTGDWPWSAPSFEEISGFVALEGRLFARPERFAGQARHSGSLLAEPEAYIEWDDDTSVTLTPFLRLDSADPGRSHADLRELELRVIGDDWELAGGVGKVFWGVAESKHLVDIINQTDVVENLDLEDKLGQPMANLTLIRDWGYVDLFAMPYFRERTFQERGGRLRNALVADVGQARFTSKAGRWHPDFALRYANSFGDWDLGLAHFYGTSRDPTLNLGLSSGGELVLVPEYELINQTSLDLQYTTGAWLWKLEALFRQGQKNRLGTEQNYYSAIGGFEYTLYGIMDSVADLGLIGEYIRDSRRDKATDPLENDVFVGARLALNDEPDSQLLAGIIQDLDQSTRLMFVEASRRVGESMKLTVELRAFSAVQREDLLSDLRDDDFIQIELAYYY
ncbi:MAG: hypothetical protein QF926_07905 [Alphaproteobacteria bacterium]|jgi:hypothetical protein|nr:hypothetical protein [Alphaproteobacteria bacterium]